MSCIVGIKTAEAIYLGGDSASSTTEGLQTILVNHKVFFLGKRHPQMLLGCTGSLRLLQLLRYRLQLPAYQEGMEVEEYLVSHWIEAIRDCLKSGGWAKKKDEEEWGGNFLLGYRGRLFEVQEDYHLSEPINSYEAVGSGAQIALGALYATEHLPAEQRIQQALEAASFHTAFVRAPFCCLKLPNDEWDQLQR